SLPHAACDASGEVAPDAGRSISLAVVWFMATSLGERSIGVQGKLHAEVAGRDLKLPSRLQSRNMRETRMLRESLFARSTTFDLTRDRLLDLGEPLSPADDVCRDRLRYHHQAVAIADDEITRRHVDAGRRLSGQRDRRVGAR